jgi:N-methylhydantoinase B/oxoprolinase/acetone carboxylase alpha subunit
MSWLLEKFAGNLRSGDVIVSNDPYGGMSGYCTRSPDFLAGPSWWDAPRSFATTRRSRRFPGGMGIACAEMYEEGL